MIQKHADGIQPVKKQLDCSNSVFIQRIKAIDKPIKYILLWKER